MTHKIAIISLRNVSYSHDYDNYGDILIANSITDWEEVTDQEYDLLHRAAGRLGTFHVVEQIQDQKTFIAKTIEDYRRLVQSEADKMAADKKKREEAALARKLKRDLKDKESKLELFKKLQKELGPEALVQS